MTDSLVFDVGCNNGADSDFYLRKGFTVVAVEANPSLCAQLKGRFSRQIADGSFILVEKAIAEIAGEVEFFMNAKESTLGTIMENVAKRDAMSGAEIKKISVPSILFSSVIAQYGVPYYLKVDIEGAEILCLKGLFASPVRPRFVSIESNQSSWWALRDELGHLAKLGYRKFQVVEQSAVPNQLPPQPAREGIYIDHRFELGSSGLFGRELPGAWSTRSAALAQYSGIYMRNKLLGLSKRIPVINELAFRYPGRWYNTHAML